MTKDIVRVVVVEDDFRVARLHADLVSAVAGMTVAGVAHTAADARRLIASEQPDLVLLDEYLPDERGSSLLPSIGCAVMVISADDDAFAVRRTIARGAVNVVLKPFTPAVLTSRLEAFVAFWTSLAGGPADQRAVDRALAALRAGDAPAAALPKGRSVVTADAIREVLRSARDALTAIEVAEETGVSRATAQRYLSDLTAAGRVELTLRYGTTGRPEHRYTWRG